jgi:hypothetical protein
MRAAVNAEAFSINHIECAFAGVATKKGMKKSNAGEVSVAWISGPICTPKRWPIDLRLVVYGSRPRRSAIADA